MRRLPMRMNSGTVPSIFTSSPFAVRSSRNLIYLTVSLQACCRKSLFIRLGPAPVWSSLATLGIVLDDTPTEILTGYVGVGKNDATSWGSSLNWTIKLTV